MLWPWCVVSTRSGTVALCCCVCCPLHCPLSCAVWRLSSMSPCAVAPALCPLSAGGLIPGHVSPANMGALPVDPIGVATFPCSLLSAALFLKRKTAIAYGALHLWLYFPASPGGSIVRAYFSTCNSRPYYPGTKSGLQWAQKIRGRF